MLKTNSFIKLKSSSKINLALWIKEKREDDYHDIETIFFENNNLQDDIEIEYQESKNLEIEVNFKQIHLNNIIPKEKNLAYKAVKLFLERINRNGKIKIIIDKKISMEAGLGGGSSNAASVLKGLNKIFANVLSQEDLLELTLKLGSDVPFFIIGGTCLGLGRGEILSPLENRLKLDIKIVKPENISVSTKWAYEQIDSREFLPDHKLEINNLTNSIKTGNKDLFLKNVFNDFESVVFSYYPELINIRKQLLQEGYKVSGLCGSGSAMFGIR